MKSYSHHALNDFIICCGYKGDYIKDYFANYFLRCSDITFNFKNGKNETLVRREPFEKWCVTLVDTGSETQTARRLAKLRNYIEDEYFCLTYGDGVANIDMERMPIQIGQTCIL